MIVLLTTNCDIAVTNRLDLEDTTPLCNAVEFAKHCLQQRGHLFDSARDEIGARIFLNGELDLALFTCFGSRALDQAVNPADGDKYKEAGRAESWQSLRTSTTN